MKARFHPELGPLLRAIDALLKPDLSDATFAALLALGVPVCEGANVSSTWPVLKAAGYLINDISDAAALDLAEAIHNRGHDLFEPYDDPDHKRGPITSFLHDAICSGSTELVAKLLVFGADPAQRMPGGVLPGLDGFDALAHMSTLNDDGEKRALLKSWRARHAFSGLLADSSPGPAAT